MSNFLHKLFSTLLRIISGELEADTGSVEIDPRATAVYLAQNVSNYLAPNLTVFEHILIVFDLIRRNIQ